MVYNFGVHLELKAVEIETFPFSVEVFPADDSQSDLVRFLTEQFACLTATSNRNSRGRGNRNNNDRFRPRNDNDCGNRNNDTNRGNRNKDNTRSSRNSYNNRDIRFCDSCGKTGHIQKICPNFTDSPQKSDRSFPTASPDVLLPPDTTHPIL